MPMENRQPPEGRRRNRLALLHTVLPVVYAFVLLSFVTLTVADADLWGHLTFGRDIAAAHAVHTSEPYSFTSDEPWINHEWLAEVLMWGAYSIAGARSLVALKVLLACLVAFALLVAWRPLRLARVRRDTLLAAAALGTWPQLQAIRPQAFSVALFAWLLVVLERVRAGRLRWLLVVPPIFAVWVNLHGGWIVGAGALAIVVAGALFDPACSWRGRLAMATTAAASAAATLCNPYGPRMLAFLAETVRPDRSEIAEWHPLPSMGPYVAALWVPAAVALAFVLLRRRREVPPSSLLICLMLAVGSFRVYRLMAFFTVAVAVLLVPHLPRRRPEGAQGGAPAAARFAVPAATWLLAFCCALAMFGGRIKVDAPWAPEPQAAPFIAAHGLRGRMLTWFDYGEYAIWHLSPAIRVSMDGRRETVYSEQMRELHLRIYQNAPDAVDDVARLNPDHAWLPRGCPMVATLEAHGWHRVFDGPRSVVLTRSAAPVPVRVTAPVTSRSFPGP